MHAMCINYPEEKEILKQKNIMSFSLFKYMYWKKKIVG